MDLDFTTDDVTLFVIQMSRGKEVLKEVLGENFDGIMVAGDPTPPTLLDFRDVGRIC